MKNNILFFPSHDPIQYEAIAKSVKEKRHDVNVKFFLLDKPYYNFSFDYVTYEDLVDSCDLLSVQNNSYTDTLNCSSNDLFFMDRIHKKNINFKEVHTKYLIALKKYLIKNSITHVFGYALSDSITFGCYHVCQDLGIKYYYVNVTRLASLYHLSTSINGEGEPSNLQSFSKDNILELVVNLSEKKIVPDYASDPTMVINKSIFDTLHSLITLAISRFKRKNKYLDFQPPILNAIKRFLNRKLSYRELLKYTHDFERLKNKKFIFYPLHIHPETSTLVWGRWFNNQYEILKLIARVLPDDVMLLVKEHKVATGRHRKGFYKKIASLPNTFLIHHETNSHEIISASRAVATISGTAGFEALCYNKPVLLFGEVDYQCAQNVIMCRDFSRMREYIFKALNQKPYDILYDPQFFDMMKLKLDGSVLLDGYRPYITSGPLVEALTSLYMEKLH